MSSTFSSLLLTRVAHGALSARVASHLYALAHLGPVTLWTLGATPPANIPADTVREHRHFVPGPARLSRVEQWKQQLWPLLPAPPPELEPACDPEVVAALQDHLDLRRYGVTVVEHLTLAGYVPVLHECGCHVIFDADFSTTERQRQVDRNQPATSPRQRALQRLARRRLQAYERNALRTAAAVWVSSPHERAALPIAPEDVPCHVVPTSLPSPGRPAASAGGPTGGALTLTMWGDFGHVTDEAAAIRFVQRVLPALRRQGYLPRLRLVGHEHAAAVRALAGQTSEVLLVDPAAVSSSETDAPGIACFPSAVSAGPREDLLRAFAAERAVVATPAAVAGLNVRDGEHLLLREQPEDLARAISMLWIRPSLRERLGEAARQYVETHHTLPLALEAIAESVRPFRAPPPKPYLVWTADLTEA